MKFLLLALGLFVGSASQAAQVNELEFANGALKAQLTWLVGPEVANESKLKIEWLDEAGNKVELSGKLEVVLWMPSMGHGSSPTSVKEVDEGVFEISNIRFIMDGSWEVKVVWTDANQNQETQILEVHL